MWRNKSTKEMDSPFQGNDNEAGESHIKKPIVTSYEPPYSIYMKEYALILVSTILVNNFVLVKFLGLCPFMGVSRKL